MDIDSTQLSPPLRLAVAYAQTDLREAFALLLSFDERLGDIVARAGEPMIAQMKIAWWNDAIASDPAKRPKGEPMILALNSLSVAGVDTAMEKLIDAWSLLLAAEDWTDLVVSQFAVIRSDAIFGSYASWLSENHDVTSMGIAWAASSLQQRFGSRVTLPQKNKNAAIRTTRKLRPLSILAVSVTNPSSSRMMWHALTGR